MDGVCPQLQPRQGRTLFNRTDDPSRESVKRPYIGLLNGSP